MRSTRRALLAAATLALPGLARAQGGFPSRGVRIVVPYPPGGGVDVMARALAEALARAWNQPVVVENRGGGATIPGVEHVARSPADGHVLLLTSDSSITSNPHLYANMPADPIRDLAPVTLLAEVHQMVVVHPALAARDMAGLVEAARARPGALNYGSYGPGSQPQLLFEALKAERRVDIAHVPYRGLAPALQATIAGEVQMTLAGAGIAGPHISAGTLRALAIGRPARLPNLPDVPTLEEAGIGQMDPRTWFGLFAPAGTSRATLGALQAGVAAVMAEPGFRERHVTGRGMSGHANTPEEFAAFIAADLADKGRLIRLSGARVE
jgi:tripartite-type tricarboxylate transporter receptor subunit TctC